MRREDMKEFFRGFYVETAHTKKLLTEQDVEDAAAEGGEVEEDAEEAADQEDAALGEPTPDDQDGNEAELDRFKSSFDDQLNSIFVDVESGALETARSQQESFSLKQILLAEADDESVIDVEHFASEVARIIKNIDIFIDLEDTILNKAKAYLADKYDKSVVDNFEEIMADQFDIESADAPHKESEYEIADQTLQQPIAVGAMPAGGGAV